MKNKLSIVLLITLLLSVAGIGIRGQWFPPPPEPYTFSICGPEVVTEAGVGNVTNDMLAQGCQEVFVRPYGGSAYRFVFGTKLIIGEQIELRQK